VGEPFRLQAGPFPRHATASNGDVRAAALEIDPVEAGLERLQLQLHIGVIAIEVRQARHDERVRERREAVHHQTLGPVGIHQPPRPVRDELQARRNVMEIFAAGLVELEAPLGPGEERQTDLRFEDADLVADRGGRHVELGRGAGDAQASDGLERSQRGKWGQPGHVVSIRRRISSPAQRPLCQRFRSKPRGSPPQCDGRWSLTWNSTPYMRGSAKYCVVKAKG
jgi:hypothetical protein